MFVKKIELLLKKEKYLRGISFPLLRAHAHIYSKTQKKDAYFFILAPRFQLISFALQVVVNTSCTFSVVVIV